MGDLAAALAAAPPTLHNYAQIFAFAKMDPTLSRQAAEQAFTIWKALGDAVLVCTTAALLALLLGTFLAYAISRFNVGGKYFRHTILTIRMIPPIVVAISILIYYAILIPFASTAVLGVRISLFDTYIGLILIYTVTTLPFVIWMMLTFIDEVPYTLEHAARLMGAGRMTVIWRIVLPLVASGMVVMPIRSAFQERCRCDSAIVLNAGPSMQTYVPRACTRVSTFGDRSIRRCRSRWQ